MDTVRRDYTLGFKGFWAAVGIGVMTIAAAIGVPLGQGSDTLGGQLAAAIPTGIPFGIGLYCLLGAIWDYPLPAGKKNKLARAKQLQDEISVEDDRTQKAARAKRLEDEAQARGEQEAAASSVMSKTIKAAAQKAKPSQGDTRNDGH